MRIFLWCFSCILQIWVVVPAKTLHRPGLLRPFGLRRAKVMFLPVPPPPLCTLTNKSTVRKYGTYDKQKRTGTLLKTTLPYLLYGPFRHRTYSKKDGYLPQNDFGSRFSAIACRLFLVPMAHFGIESIAKKDGYPSQNDFALSALWLVFGIEGLMQKGWSVQKTTLSFSLWPVSA